MKVSEAERPAMYHEMSVTFDEIGKRMADMGMKFGVHAHLGSNFQTRRDVDAIMERTNPHWQDLYPSLPGVKPVPDDWFLGALDPGNKCRDDD